MNSLPQNLAGKTAIVTGSSRGIGRAIAIELGQRGATVIVNYTSATSKEAALETCELAGNNSIAVRADLQSLADIESLAATANSTGKNKGVDILVHNAGNGQERKLELVTEEFYDLQMNTNVKGPVFLTKACLPYFNQGLRMVLVSSVSARMGIAQQTTYAASKAAVEALARVWASELGHRFNATVNCVNPGPVDTDMWTESATDEQFMKDMQPIIDATPAAPRIGKVSDIAPLVAFLCSEESKWTTGSILSANGGMLMI